MNRKLFIITLFALLALSAGAIAVQAGPKPALHSLPGGSLAKQQTGSTSPIIPNNPQSTVASAFTYQGRLAASGSPANGQYDLVFTLYDALAGGNQAANPITITNQTVSDGLFTVSLDFGASAFQGSARWMAIAVKQTGGGSFTTLSPRQPLTAAPYAMSLMPGAVITGTTGTGNALLTANNSGSGYGLTGQNASATGAGVYGSNSNLVDGTGVLGSGYYGVQGQGTGFGVSGSGATAGVYGVGQGTGFGVQGQSSNIAVYGVSTSSGYGVYGTTGGSGTGVYGNNSGNGGGYGVQGTISSTIGYGVYGANTSSGGGTGVYGSGYYGVQGLSSTAAGYGVSGFNTVGVGVRGDSNGSDGVFGGTFAAGGRSGVHGVAFSGNNYGVFGFSANSYGVYGQSTNAAGVYGTSSSTDPGSSRGVYGFSPIVGVHGTTVDGIGVLATAGSITGTALSAQNTNGGIAISASTAGNTVAVFADAGNGIGVYANGNAVGVQGNGSGPGGIGVRGSISSTTGYGVTGFNSSTTGGSGVYGSGYYAVLGESSTAFGVYGNSTAASGTGVYGSATAANGTGVYGAGGNSGVAGVGINGVSGMSNSSGIGVHGSNPNPSGIGVQASGSGTNTALQIDNGALKVSGTNRPVFVHTAIVSNIAGNFTYVDNPFSNGDPNAILIVTPNYGSSAVYNNHPIGVFYESGASKWAIFNQDLVAMPVNATFNVLVVKR